jgi:hypothetical protein
MSTEGLGEIDAHVVEVFGRMAGIVVRDDSDEDFDFFAAGRTFVPLEGRRFRELGAAERAARQLASQAKTVAPRKNNLDD